MDRPGAQPSTSISLSLDSLVGGLQREERGKKRKEKEGENRGRCLCAGRRKKGRRFTSVPGRRLLFLQPLSNHSLLHLIALPLSQGAQGGEKLKKKEQQEEEGGAGGGLAPLYLSDLSLYFSPQPSFSLCFSPLPHALRPFFSLCFFSLIAHNPSLFLTPSRTTPLSLSLTPSHTAPLSHSSQSLSLSLASRHLSLPFHALPSQSHNTLVSAEGEATDQVMCATG